MTPAVLRHIRELSSHLRGRSGPGAPPQLDLLEPALTRYSRDGDRAALERLAALDGRKLADAAFLLAELDGQLVAAAWLDLDVQPLSEPFRPTGILRELLTLRARQIRESSDRLAVAKTPPVLREAT